MNFSNTTTGVVDAGYSWNFGDASTSAVTNPSHLYSLPDSYQVSLTASNSAGCNNVLTRQVKIYSRPSPDFSVGLPPFSCSNSATAFQNNTPALTDSNISTWAWQFGDINNGLSNIQGPSYTYLSDGNYSVILTATSDKGCAKSIQKSIAIAAGPVADFTVAPSCLNLPTKFTDLSSGAVQTRSWQIGPATFGTANPTYTFTFPETIQQR
ncbi:MAG: PKD domain-containing protein [Bacteroidota bacterium]